MFSRYHLFLPFLTSPTISDIILRKNYLFKGTRFQKKQFGWKEYADLPLFFANLSSRINLTQFSFRVKSTFKILNVFFFQSDLTFLFVTKYHLHVFQIFYYSPSKKVVDFSTFSSRNPSIFRNKFHKLVTMEEPSSVKIFFSRNLVPYKEYFF